MCGIVGILNFNKEPIIKKHLKAMTESIVYRGPDGEGFYIDRYLGFGHRRLAIIDLSSAGSQPMISTDQNYIINYNGEIYNFMELRIELQTLGYRFFSKTDTEVVLNSWIEWGEKCIQKFNGMFAFSIWNKKEETLFLVRDRYGVKPLYYANFNNIFIFASEQKAILTHPNAERTLDREALLEYFTFQNIFTNKTLVEKIKILPPASIAKIDLKNNTKMSVSQYWDYDFNDSKSYMNMDECIEELDYLMKQSIKRQSISDVETGSFLSSGIDSGIITAIASKLIPNIKTFTCGFDLKGVSGLELNFDERKRSRFLSNLFKTNHHEIKLTSEDMEKCLEVIVKHIEEPRLGQSYPNFYSAKLAGKFVKVVLSGTGGDELFCGYPWRYFSSNQPLKFDDFIDSYYLYWQRLIDNKQLKLIFSPILKEVQNVWTKDIFKDVFKHNNKHLINKSDFIHRSLYFESKTFLHSLLIIDDKLSMSQSLEVRFPFLDNDVVDFATKCPVEFKIKKLKPKIRIDENMQISKTKFYYQKTKDSKLVLRNVSQKYLPKKISRSIKQGFTGPDNTWFRSKSMDFVKRKLKNKEANIYKYFDYKETNKIIDLHFHKRVNKRLFIWSLLTFEEYLCQNQ